MLFIPLKVVKYFAHPKNPPQYNIDNPKIDAKTETKALRSPLGSP
jgi:hypothetical protein